MRSTPTNPAAPARTRRTAPPAAQQTAAASQTPPPLPSGQLLQGRKIVEIEHNGAIYRLQATRLGKLILTK